MIFLRDFSIFPPVRLSGFRLAPESADADIVAQFDLVLIEVDDAFVAFRRNIFRNRRVDAHLGGGRHFAMDRQRQRRIERLRTRIGDDHDIAVGLDAGGDRPLDVDGIENVDIVIDDGDVLDIGDRKSAMIAFLPSPGTFLIEATMCQWQQPPGVTLIAVVCTPASKSTRRAAAS